MRTDGRIENLSEQELGAYTEQLIRQAEAEGLIPAPAHMKQEILDRSRSLDYQLRVQTRQIPKKLQFLYYSLKVGAAVVMALFLVMMVPKEIPDMSSTAGITVQQEESLGNKLNQGMRTMNRMLNNMNWYMNVSSQTED